LEKAAGEFKGPSLELDTLLESCDANNAGEVFVALSLLGADNPSKAKQVLMQTALPSSNNFPTPAQLALAKVYLSSLTLKDLWEEILPSWGLKLRSHPDKVLPLLEVLLECTVGGFDQKKSEANTAWEGEQVQLLEAVGRQLKSTKKDLRSVASQTLVLLTRLGLGNEVGEHLSNVVSSLGSSELRLGAYSALEGVALVLLQEDENSEMMSTLADKVLTSLCVILPKDKNSTDGAKEAGFTSMLSWMQCSRRYGRATGYDKSLDYFLEAIEKYASLKGEFRFRLGNLVISSTHSEAFAESIIVDLFERKNNVVSKSLESIIEAVAKKFKATDTVPQTDAILATFILVLYAHSKGEKVPASIAKVFKDGSFLYGTAVLEAIKTDTLLNYLVHRTIAMHCKLSCKDEDGGENGKNLALVRLSEKRSEQPTPSAAAITLAVCVANSLCVSPKLSAYSSALSSLKTVVTYAPAAAKSTQAMIISLFSYMNESSLKNDEAKMLLNDTYEMKEVDESMNKLPSDATREPLSEDAFYKSIRCAAKFLVSSSSAGDVDALWKGIVLTHAGTTQCSGRRQRVALVSHLLDILKDKVVPVAEQTGMEETMYGFANFVALCAAAPQFEFKGDDDETIGQTGIGMSVHNAACSLITTLGGIAGNFDAEFDDTEGDEKTPYSFASKLCTQTLPSSLVAFMDKSMTRIESLTEEDIALYQCPEGVLFKCKGENDEKTAGDTANNASTVEKKTAATRKAKGKGGGFDAFADEEWEKQVKKDLAKKKAQVESTGSKTSESMSAEKKKLLADQTLKREKYASILNVGFPRTLAAIRALCESDIEVGNTLLPLLGMPVIRAVVSPSAAMRVIFELRCNSFNTLAALAGCVYEIDEIHALTLARALEISFKHVKVANTETEEAKDILVVQALPAVCPSAACAIYEMDDYGDCLSGNSFAFLFPIISAALTGPRNVPGCDSALQVLYRHLVLLDGDEEDPIVKPMRKEIAMTLLELLSHDRSQTFNNPTAYEALIECYITNEASSGPPLSASEIAPLLGERGALGPENGRVAAMETFASIAEKHSKFVRSNPLIENRMWLNCHAPQERIRTAARKAWLISHDQDVSDDINSVALHPPSKMYAVPLLPLLSHDDESIAAAAASALSNAIGIHADSAEKNIVKVCNLYIGSFPAPETDETPKSSPFPVHAQPVAQKPVKKIIDTGLKKKPTTKKVSGVSSSLAKITGAPAPKKKAATKALIAKTAPKERTIDPSELLGQFVTQSSVKKDSGEADSDSKVAIRLGVLRAVSALTDSSSKVRLDLHTLKVLIGFLIAYGLGDINEDVRNTARDSARDIVACFGSSKEVIAFFLPQFEQVLKTGKADVSCIDPLSPEKVPQNIAASDYRKEGVVILLGSIALHLNDESDAEKIDGIIDMLLNALKTPVSNVHDLSFSLDSSSII
jgi:hypothetical protein